MSKLSFDYSKWDRLELSDDEDTHHPNLDKNLNIRVNRITRGRKEEEIDAEKKKLEEAGKLDQAAKVESKRPLHVDNVCRVAEERTIINRADGVSDRTTKGEEFNPDDYFEFKKDHQQLLEEFTNADWEKSAAMLHDKGGILLDDCANNYFMLTALEEEMKGNSETVLKLCRQGQIISQIHQIAKPMHRPPRDLVGRFFDKFQTGGGQEAFQQGVDSFLGHIQARAVQKKKEEAEQEKVQEVADAEEQGEPVSLVEAMHSMDVEQRRGPGGLDPVEVYESLPPELQECFKSGDVEKLKQVASHMDEEEFSGYFQKCIDAGLWKPG